jgi:lipopolysaccharide export system permease protein
MLRSELFRVRTDLAASLVHVGQFTEPAPDLTVYAQSSDAGGAMRNLFVLQQKPGGDDIAFFAARGKIAKQHGAPVLIMRDGSEQQFARSGVLEYLKFDEYIFDLSGFISRDQLIRYKVGDRYLHELLFPDLTQAPERRERRGLLAEAHARLSTPLYNIAFMALALAAVIGGPFSRLGYGKRIVAFSVVAAVSRIAGFAVLAASARAPWVNVFQYLIPLAAAGWAFRELFRHKLRRRIPLRRIERAVPATGAAA